MSSNSDRGLGSYLGSAPAMANVNASSLSYAEARPQEKTTVDTDFAVVQTMIAGDQEVTLRDSSGAVRTFTVKTEDGLVGKTVILVVAPEDVGKEPKIMRQFATTILAPPKGADKETVQAICPFLGRLTRESTRFLIENSDLLARMEGLATRSERGIVDAMRRAPQMGTPWYFAEVVKAVVTEFTGLMPTCKDEGQFGHVIQMLELVAVQRDKKALEVPEMQHRQRPEPFRDESGGESGGLLKVVERLAESLQPHDNQQASKSQIRTGLAYLQDWQNPARAPLDFALLHALSTNSDLQARVGELIQPEMLKRLEASQLRAVCKFFSGASRSLSDAIIMLATVGNGTGELTEGNVTTTLMHAAVIFDATAGVIGWPLYTPGAGAAALITRLVARFPTGFPDTGVTAGLLLADVLLTDVQEVRTTLRNEDKVVKRSAGSSLSPEVKAALAEIAACRMPFKYAGAKVEVFKPGKKREAESTTTEPETKRVISSASANGAKTWCYLFMQDKCPYGVSCKYTHDKQAPCPRGSECLFLKAGKCFHSVH
jgi:hypothetical protein